MKMTKMIGSDWNIFYHHPPFTCNLGFIRHEFENVKEFLAEWVNSQDPPPPRTASTPTRCRKRGLDALAPRSSQPELAFVLLECAGPWVMWQYRYEDSVDPRMTFVNKRRGWTTVSATCVDDRNNLWSGLLAMKGNLFAYREGGLGRPFIERAISVTEVRTGQYSWDTFGTPLPFERVDLYRSRRIRDRFVSETLFSYLESLGILVRDPSFFSGEAYDFEM